MAIDWSQLSQILITLAIIVVTMAAVWYVRSEKMDKAALQRFETARQFVFDAVLAAEKQYGDGTGTIKRAWVADMVAKFGFTDVIDEDLLTIWINTMLERYEAERLAAGVD